MISKLYTKNAISTKAINILTLITVIATLLLPPATFAGIYEWVTNGPAQGIIYSLAISPNYASDTTIFAGTNGSGVYKSTDSGKSWTQSGLASSCILSLAISPNYTSDHTIIVGTYGGFYKSTNGGQTWNQGGLTGVDISSLAVSPNYSSDQTIFAGTYGGGIYKSADGGTTWSQSGLAGIYISSIAISPAYNVDATIFAGASDGNGICKSADGGSTWDQINSGITSTFIKSVVISPNYALDQTVFADNNKSTDGGTSWTNSGPANTNIFSLAISPNYAADQTILAGTYGNGVYRSTDAGTTWTQVNTDLTNTNVPALAVSPDFSVDYTIFAGTWGNGVFRCVSQDTTPPVVSTTDPAHSATGIAKDKTITITFDERIQAGTAYDIITVRKSDTSQVAVNKTISGRVLTLDPTSDLTFTATYMVIIPANAVKDTANNSLAAQYTFSFTTKAGPDTAPPTVTATSPAANATGVSRDATITVTFNESIQAGTAYGNIEMKDSGGKQVATTKAISGNTLTIDPTSDLTYTATYTVSVPASSVKDASNNALASQYAFSFTTQAETTATTSTATPAAPQGLKLVSNSGMISLAWNSNSEKDISGYNIYRRLKSSGTSAKLNSSVITGTQYQDKTAEPGKTYFYSVTAVSTSGKESNNSSELEAILASVTFSDIPSDAWYKSFVSTLVSQNIIGGYPDQTFRPNNTVTRAEFTKMICLAMGWTLENPASPSFTDVISGSWSYTYVETAKSHGAIGGYEDNTFRMSKNITRAEIAKIVSGALSLPAGSSGLSDTSSHWAKDSIGACVKAGIVGGYNDGTFRPDNAATRAEAAKMIIGVLANKK